jgi:hypothetical protein
MRQLIYIGIIAVSLLTLSCNNDGTDNEDHGDSIGNEVTPGNSPVMPNSNATVIPDDNQTNTNGMDTATVDSLVPPDTLTKRP